MFTQSIQPYPPLLRSHFEDVLHLFVDPDNISRLAPLMPEELNTSVGPVALSNCTRCICDLSWRRLRRRRRGSSPPAGISCCKLRHLFAKSPLSTIPGNRPSISLGSPFFSSPLTPPPDCKRRSSRPEGLSRTPRGRAGSGCSRPPQPRRLQMHAFFVGKVQPLALSLSLTSDHPDIPPFDGSMVSACTNNHPLCRL